MLDKYELKEVLSNNVMTVVFTKVDGSERVMNCTLIPEYIPVKAPVEGQQLLNESTRQESPLTLSVWDVDSKGWRSFRLDAVKSVVKNETHIA